MFKGCDWNLLRRIRFYAAMIQQRNLIALQDKFYDSTDGGLLLHIAIERGEITI